MSDAACGIGHAGSNVHLIERAEKVLTGGRLGLFKLPDPVNLVLVAGVGSHVTDSSGNERIDYVLGSGPLLLGHAHPLVEAETSNALHLDADPVRGDLAVDQVTDTNAPVSKYYWGDL